MTDAVVFFLFWFCIGVAIGIIADLVWGKR
jgi:hypothetical protein